MTGSSRKEEMCVNIEFKVKAQPVFARKTRIMVCPPISQRYRTAQPAQVLKFEVLSGGIRSQDVVRGHVLVGVAQCCTRARRSSIGYL
jgi:hypothetical protein